MDSATIPPRTESRERHVSGSRSSERAGDVRASPRAVLLQATWTGLVTGLLELALTLVRRRHIDAAAFGALQMNRHAIWMIPVSDALIFGACGLVLAAVALVWPRGGRRLAAYGLGSLSALALLLTFPGLSQTAYVTLACGVASLLAPAMLARSRGPRRLVRVSLPVLAAIVAGLVGLEVGREAIAERGALARLPSPRAGVPNLLVIVLDTVGAGRLGLYGHPRDTSPNLARLARRGVRFDRARVTAPWTLPSHASMFTGRWPHELSARLDRPLDATFPTLAEHLRDHGYATAGFVANIFFCNAWYGLGRGFIHFEDTAVNPIEVLRGSNLGRRLVKYLAATHRDRPTAYFHRKDAPTINRDALAWLDGRPKDRPFFAFLNYYDAHDPYLLPEEPERPFGLRPVSDDDYEMLRDWHRIDKRKLSPRDVALGRDCYDDCTAYLDRHLGRLFAELERRGLMENTVVVVTSDHGEEFGEHGEFGHGLNLHRGAVHVPLLVVAPGRVPSGRVVRRSVSLRDLPATVLDLLGLGEGSPFPGLSLAGHWSGPPDSDGIPAEPVLTEVVDRPAQAPPGWKPPRSLVVDEKVYIRDGAGREELYDLDADPAESINLAGMPEARPFLEHARGVLETIDDRDRAP
jgi:arylsulfatase A-like enzyme